MLKISDMPRGSAAELILELDLFFVALERNEIYRLTHRSKLTGLRHLAVVSVVPLCVCPPAKATANYPQQPCF